MRASNEHGASLPVPVRRMRASDEHRRPSTMPVGHTRASNEHGASLPVPVRRMRAPDEHRRPSTMPVGHTRAPDEHGASLPVPVRRMRAPDRHRRPSTMRVRRMRASHEHEASLPVSVGRMRTSNRHRGLFPCLLVTRVRRKGRCCCVVGRLWSIVSMPRQQHTRIRSTFRPLTPDYDPIPEHRETEPKEVAEHHSTIQKAPVCP